MLYEVITEPPVNKRYDDIVFPVDFTLENKEKHTWISYFCNYYVSRFHLIKNVVKTAEVKDESSSYNFV